ncbi:unnamed protein product [Phaedon cochleariae]|uniref:Uncharacterized protein n=1 Tax=Phaedon cochleariae TaxID=80249 RepID=A0A9P0DD60_PHACE|nr:unnamed protein product [Phaedon cochleariae]
MNHDMNQNNNANQRNSNNSSYWSSRSMEKPNNWQASKNQCTLSKQEQDNRSKQLNPNNEAYYSSRGEK